MKVTVSFDEVRVVVPCGDGQMLIGQLIEQAVSRYSKAVGKPTETSWINVHNLKTADGGILDPDDRLIDVVDDREQLSAFYEVRDCPTQRQNGGDGTSASSGGTASPDLFHPHNFTAALLKDDLKAGLITDNSIVSAFSSPERCRRDSSMMSDSNGDHRRLSTSKPFSSHENMPAATSSVNVTELDREAGEGSRQYGIGQEMEDYEEHESSSLDSRTRAFIEFARAPARKSLQNNAAMLRWLDAQERLQERFEDDATPVQDCSRTEPIGGLDVIEPVESSRLPVEELDRSVPQDEQVNDTGTLISFANPGGPLGIHVVPSLDDAGSNTGLEIHNVEADSLIGRDGRLRVGDIIVEINGNSLIGLQFKWAQDVFRSALQSSTISMRVVSPPSTHTAENHQAVQALQNNGTASLVSINVKSAADSVQKTSSTVALRDETENPNAFSSSCSSSQQPIGTVSISSPLTKLPPAVPSRNPATVLSSAKNKFAPISSTRLIGKVVKMDLTKGTQGLGFSVTTRDNPAGSSNPIYIKNILSQGAAITDGRLQPGDRLLQVNDTEVSGKSQEEVVSLLRNTKVGDSVSLTISRQAADDELSTVSASSTQSETNSINKSDVVPDRLSAESSNSEKETTCRQGSITSVTADRKKEEKTPSDENHNVIPPSGFTFIELTISIGEREQETSSLLGVSIKGMSTDHGDIGLFIKNIIEGGAAAKDGRLRPNDRLVRLNGTSLIGQNNSEAMTALRRALHAKGSVPGCVDVTVARQNTTDAVVSNHCGGDKALNVNSAPALNSLPGCPPPAKSACSSVAGDVLPTDLSQDKKTHYKRAAKPHKLTPAHQSRTSKNVLRNVSYQLANGDSFVSDATLSEPTATPVKIAASRLGMTSPTVNGRRNEAVLIETDGSQPLKPKLQPASSGSLGNADSLDSVEVRTQQTSSHDVTMESGDSSPLESDASKTFSREGLGRQSMSEKRKGHLDPRLTAFYEQVKSARGANMKKCKSVESLKPTADALHSSNVKSGNVRGSLHRCASFESVLATSHDDIRFADVQEENINHKQTVQRNRGCNDSFRAAVDRSYVTRSIHIDEGII